MEIDGNITDLAFALLLSVELISFASLCIIKSFPLCSSVVSACILHYSSLRLQGGLKENALGICECEADLCLLFTDIAAPPRLYFYTLSGTQPNSEKLPIELNSKNEGI